MKHIPSFAILLLLSFLSDMDYFYYKIKTGENTIVKDPEKAIALTRGSGYTNLQSYSSTINGKAIPKAGYGIGATYDPYGNGYNGYYQCYGFALEIYDYIWGTNHSSTKTYPGYISSYTAMRDLVLVYPRGTDMRFTYPHSMILVSRTYSYVYVYHANWTPELDNTIYVTQFTWSQFYSYFKTFSYVNEP